MVTRQKATAKSSG